MARLQSIVPARVVDTTDSVADTSLDNKALVSRECGVVAGCDVYSIPWWHDVCEALTHSVGLSR